MHCRKGGGSQSIDVGYGVTAAADNSIYLAGTQYDSTVSRFELAMVKLDADGELLWEWQVRLDMETFLPLPICTANP